MSEQQLVDLENSLQALKAEFKKASAGYAELRDGRSKKEDRLVAFRAWHAAAIEFFNAHDRVIAVGARVNADKNSTWYTDRAETAANLLHTICEHYQAVYDRSEDFDLDAASFQPSLTAFANIQRIVKGTHPDIARQYRDKFVHLNLPTHGFDRDESESLRQTGDYYHPATWEKITVMVLAGVIILGVLYAALQKDQIPARNFVLLRILMSAAMGVMGGVIPGFLRVDLSFKGALIRAGGGLALGIITYFFTPTVVPNDAPTPGS